MMKKIITKSGTLYVSESALNNQYTAEKLEVITDFKKTKPLLKATTDEIIYLMDKVFGKKVTPSQCVKCSRSKWLTMLQNYENIALKLLEVKDQSEIDNFELVLKKEAVEEEKVDVVEEEKTEEEKEEEKKETTPTPKKKGKVKK